ncbi:hypothetical protein D9756_008924 [Leucocoprinus leucothites]|uniref:Uncharacterized protein n=1 Tax=Leucocoprinus leucothites TaxID=201217 RepID=A0A8H5CX82_9AGAR|nr:hypothetical protein D9756_008924 [Leucoagaricus leucothites]
MKTHLKVPQRPKGFQRKVAIPSGKAKETTAISPSQSASNPYPPQQHTPDQAHTPAPAWSGPETSMAQAAERLGLQTPSHGTASSPSSLDSTPPATPSDLWPNFPIPLEGVGLTTAQVNALVGPPSIVTTQSEPLPYTHPYEFATPYQQGYRRPAHFPASNYHVPLQRNMPEAPISNTWACSPSVFGGHPTTYPSDPLSLNFPVDPFFAQMTGFPSIQSSSWTQPEMGSIFGTMDWLEYSVNSDIGHYQRPSASASAMFLGFDHFDFGTGGGSFVPAGNSMEGSFIWGADLQTFKDPLIDEDKEFMEMMRQAMP